MNLKNRVGRLLAQAQKRERLQRGKSVTRLLTGLEWEAVLDAVDKAIDPADQDLIAAIEAHVEEAARTALRHPTTGGPWHDESGEQLYQTHFFLYWLMGLRTGSWALPNPIPRAVLEGFNARYGCVLWRCEDCLTGLGNASRYSACPVCGSSNLSHKKLAVTRHWEYTPLP